jgi:hypothetical protein
MVASWVDRAILKGHGYRTKRREGKKKVSEKSKKVNCNTLAWTMLKRHGRMTGWPKGR